MPPLTEFIFEAYCFLRKRDGEGSPLPDKADVKQHAALMMAFVTLKLTAKLPLYLWENRGLSDAQIRAVLEKQESYLGPDMKNQWTYHLKKAGLADLARRRAGGRPRREKRLY
jgi:hypothetical protein